MHANHAMTGTRIFESLQVAVEPTYLAHPLALEMLRQGDIAGMVYVAAKPAELFQSVKPDDNLHFMSLPADSDTGAGFSPTRFGADDYPQIIEQGNTINTLGVGSILVVYNWAPGTDRYRKVVRGCRKTRLGGLWAYRMNSGSSSRTLLSTKSSKVLRRTPEKISRA
jgi:uncharacterized protein